MRLSDNTQALLSRFRTPSDVVPKRKRCIWHRWPADQNFANRVSKLQRHGRSIREPARVVIQLGQTHHVLKDGFDGRFAAADFHVECPGHFLPRISLESRREPSRKQVSRTLALDESDPPQHRHRTVLAIEPEIIGVINFDTDDIGATSRRFFEPVPLRFVKAHFAMNEEFLGGWLLCLAL